VVTWALGTATGVLLGLFGVELVSSRFSTAGVSPLSRPEVLRALQAARSLPAADQVALPPSSPPDTAPPSPPVDAGPARPSAGPTSNPAPAPPASTLPRPGATAGTFTEAAVETSSTTSTAPPESSTTTTKVSPPPADPKAEDKNDEASTKSDKSSTSTTTAPKKVTTTTTPPAPPSRPGPSPQQQAGTQTISSAGGVVAVRYSGGKVDLKWARPNPGYQVYVRSNGPDQVIVYFYTRNHISQVVAYYNGQIPASDVQECSTQQGSGRFSCQ
jgi:hypothetical protein